MMDSIAAVRAVRASTQAIAALLLLMLSGCDEAPTAPGPIRVPIEGTWTGTITDRAAGVAQVSITLSGIDTLGLGTFILTFPDAAANASGIVQGSTQNAPTIDLILFIQAGGRDCSAPGVAYQARLALTQNRMTGTYSPSVGCPLLTGGSMELTRR
jgi:hypothetical protein